MAVETEVLVAELQARLGVFERQVLQAANKNDAALSRIEKKFSGTQRMLNKGLMFNGSALQTGLRNARQGLDSFAARAPIVGGMLQGMGTGATVAAAGVAALGAALMVARQAMSFADEIADSAAQAQVGVEALQEYRFAAVQAGAEIKDADEALKGLSTTLGRAIAGEARALKWFKAIGFTREQLQDLGTAEALLPLIADRIANLGTEAERAAVAEKLGVRPLLPLLQEGSEGLARMTAKAREMGVVMDTQTVKSLGEAHDKAEALGMVIRTNMMTAFANLAPVLIWITGLLAGISQRIREIMDSFAQVENRATASLESRYKLLTQRQNALIGRPVRGSVKNEWERLARERAEIEAELKRRREARANDRPPPTGDDHVDVSTSSGSRGPRRDREAEAKAERDRARRVADEIYRAQLAQFDEEIGIFRDLQERHGFEQERLDMEQQHEREALAARDDLTAEERAKLEAAMEARQLAEKRNMIDRQHNETAEAEKAELEAIADLNTQLLRLASERATSWQERRRLELEMLEIAQAQRRADLALLVETGKLTQAQADKRAALLDILDAAERRGVEENTAGPLERARREFEVTSDELEELAVEGVRGLGNAAVDVLMKTKSASEAIKDLWQSLLHDILKMLADQYINKPATDILGQIFSAFGFGAAGGTSGGGGGGGGYAMGGRPPVGKTVDVGEFGREKFVADMPGTIVPNSTLRLIEGLNPGAIGGGNLAVSAPVSIAIDARGADREGLASVQAELRALQGSLPRQVKGIVAEAFDRRQIRTRAR